MVKIPSKLLLSSFVYFVALCLYGQGRKTDPFLIPKHAEYEDKTLDEAHYFQTLSQQISKDYTFTLKSNAQDELGYTHKKYNQFYRGVQVENAILNVHIRYGYVYLVNGGIFKISRDNVRTSITASQAETYALQAIGQHRHRILIEQKGRSPLVWAPRGGDFHNEFVLCYRVDVKGRDTLLNASIYVDAVNGQPIWNYSHIQYNTVGGTGKTYFSGVVPIQIDSQSSSFYRLHDYARGNGIITKNLNHGTSISSAIDYTNTGKSWTDTSNKKHASIDIHWGIESTYDYYKTKHGRNGMDGNNLATESYYPYSTNFVNAAWTGTYMIFGEGNTSMGFYPMTSLDILGHEYTHGLTQYTANLVYQMEYGALNESFSDIFGKAVEYSKKPTSFSWIEGKEASTNGLGVRNMSNPKSNGNPDTYNGTYWNDNNDVHYNSSIQNLWFYILSIGKTGTNDLGNSYNVTGIGMDKAEKIAFRNLVYYLSPYSEYSDARMYSIQAAGDLYGICSNEKNQTANAWYAVGVGGIYNPNFSISFAAKDTIICSINDTVEFTNTSSLATNFNWKFGDGNTSSVTNPKHKYSNYGIYTVRLYGNHCSTGVLDSSIKTAYIKVDSSSPNCSWVKFPKSGTVSLSGCNFNIVDDGGVQGNYSDNVTSKIVLSNNVNKKYLVHVISDEILDYSDYLNLYNGTTYNPWNYFLRVSGGSSIYYDVISDSSRITLAFFSDYSDNHPGFKINVQCANLKPKVSFHAENTSLCHDSVRFYNETQDNSDTVTYLWSFGDGTTSTLKNPSYIYSTTGTYTIKLKACNPNGCDSFTRTSYIYYKNNVDSCGRKMGCGNTSTMYGCTGVLLDNGGASNNYSNNCISTVTPYVGTNKIHKLRFEQFKLAIGDTLIIGKGYEYENNIVGKFTGSNLPYNGQPFYIKSSRFFAKFISDSSQVDSGYILRYICEDAPPVINAIYVDDSSSCNSDFNFWFNSTGSYTSLLWDFGDGGQDRISYYPTHTYQSPGVYTVKLTLCNLKGCDSLIKTQFIHYDTSLIECAEEIPTYGSKYIEGCNGYIIDAGRRSTYPNNSDGFISLYNYGGMNYKIKFHQFALKPGDSLYIGDNNYNLLYTFSGNTLPNNGNYITIPSSWVSLRFYSDTANVDSGYLIEYQCIEPSIDASFIAIDSHTCSGYVEFYNNNRANNSYYYWDFGDGTYSTYQYASHQYQTPGSYTVKLKICSASGSTCDSVIKANYIQYNPNDPQCEEIRLVANQTISIRQCQGRIIDDGGRDSNYSDGQYSNVDFFNPNGYSYKVKFEQFKLGANDLLEINASGFYNTYTGSTLPESGNYITLGTMFNINFSTDYQGNDSGFVMYYTCNNPNNRPIASFLTADTMGCDSVHFINNSLYGSQYFWDFGDGHISAAVNPTHVYDTDGDYDVFLRVCNANSCDSIKKINYIHIAHPMASFTSSDTVKTGVVTINNTSTSASQYSWYLDNALISTLPNLNKSISKTGFHTLKLVASNGTCSDAYSMKIFFRKSSLIDFKASHSLSLYPNPSHGTLSITMDADNKSRYQIKVYDMTGRQIRNIGYKMLSHAPTTLDMSDIESGTYRLELTNDQDILSLPFEIIH